MYTPFHAERVQAFDNHLSKHNFKLGNETTSGFTSVQREAYSAPTAFSKSELQDPQLYKSSIPLGGNTKEFETIQRQTFTRPQTAPVFNRYNHFPVFDISKYKRERQ